MAKIASYGYHVVFSLSCSSSSLSCCFHPPHCCCILLLCWFHLLLCHPPCCFHHHHLLLHRCFLLLLLHVLHCINLRGIYPPQQKSQYVYHTYCNLEIDISKRMNGSSSGNNIFTNGTLNPNGNNDTKIINLIK